MKNNINILNALNESLEEEFKAKRKLKEAENNSKYEVKTYHIEDMGGHTMALFGQFKNGNYFAGNEGGINVYDEDVWPYYEDYEKSENMDWEEYNKNHLIDDINPDINTKVFNSIMRYTNFMDVEENLDEEVKIDYISKEDLDKIPDDYKTKIKDIIKTSEFRGEDPEEIKQLYYNLGYDENDYMILSNSKNGTILKPVKLIDNANFTQNIDKSNIMNESTKDKRVINLVNEIIDYYGSDMGNWFDEIKDNDEDIYNSLEKILENKEENKEILFSILDEIKEDKNYQNLANKLEKYLNESVKNNKYMNEASFKDKVSAIKKSLKKNDKRLSNKSAQKSAEKIAGSMVKNEAQEFVITYIPDNNQKDKTASISVQGNNKQQATQQARQTIGNAAIVSIQPLTESKVTDYISMDELDDLIKNNSILGNITNSFRVLDDMTIEITTDMGKSYYKIIKNDDGKLEAYWINKDGEALGDTFILKEDEVITIPNTEVETDYIINDVTVLDNISDGDVQAPDMEALLTLIDESLKSKYTNEWGRIKTLSSSKNEAYSYALVDISTPEILKEFEEKGISDVAIGKNLILESIAGMYKFKVNNLNGTTKYSKVTTNPQQTIYEWIESEFLQEAKEEKAKEAEILKAKTEKETVENYIANRIDLKQEIENIKMFIDLSKQVKAQDEMKKSIQDRMYAFAVEIPQNIEIKNNDDKYELSFSNLDQVVEIIFGKEWVKEKEEIPEVIKLKEDLKIGDKAQIVNSNELHNGKTGEVTYIDSDIITVKLDNGRSFNYDKNQVKKLNEAYEQFNIGNIEVVFNPDTYECLYSIPSADVKDKKINLTKIPTVDTPYDTNTIIKDYIETRFGRIPSEEQNKNQQQINKEQPTEEVPVEEPVNQQTTGEEMSTSEEPVEEAELPDEPGDEIDTGIDLDNSDENVDQETEEAQAETGSAVFYKIRPNQNSSIEDVREKSLDGDTPQSNYIVVDTIDLSPEQFDDFISDFSKPQSFLTGIQSLDRKNYSFNVVKITSSAADYTLLVDPLGYDYARYISIQDNI